MPPKPLILVVDDEQDFLEIVSVYLESAGFRAATFGPVSESEFVRHCEELQPALALVDIYSDAKPIGLALAAMLKSNPPTSHIKVILWSAAPEPSQLPADDFFDKNQNLDLLLEKIRRHVPSTAAI